MKFAAAALISLAVATTVTEVRAQPAAKPPAPAPAPATYQVAGIHAFLYFHGTGTFGSKDITDGTVALWNTIIGEGDAGEPASAVLVKVDLTGPSFANATGKLVVEAKVGRMRLARQTFAVSDFFDEARPQITVPLILTGVGCTDVVVTATLSGKGIKSKRQATLPFSCGE
ncbi:MAG: hypothetical protein R3B06_12420 [Kofleriaceae bacterium]